MWSRRRGGARPAHLRADVGDEALQACAAGWAYERPPVSADDLDHPSKGQLHPVLQLGVVLLRDIRLPESQEFPDRFGQDDLDHLEGLPLIWRDAEHDRETIGCGCRRCRRCRLQFRRCEKVPLAQAGLGR